MKTTRIEIGQSLDLQGEPEEFTWDLVPVVSAEKTLHLQGNGLPKIGVFVPSGSVLVGKIGKTQSYRADHMPSALELHGLDFDGLHAKYGSMWYDASVYVTPETAGVVIDAHFENQGSRQVAVVLMELGAPSPDVQTAIPEVSAAVRPEKV